MSNYNTARDGRKSYSFIGLVGDAPVKTITKGGLYWIQTKATATSGFGDVKEGRCYYSVKGGEAVGTDEVVYQITPKFLGFVNDKSLDFSKETSDVTCDKDDSDNYVTDGSVGVSGSLSGYDLMKAGEESGINLVRSQFNETMLVNAAGEYTVLPERSTADTLIIIVWDAKDVEEGSMVAIDVVPCILTSQNRAAAYKSGQSLSIDFTGKDSTEAGVHRCHIQAPYAGGFEGVDED